MTDDVIHSTQYFINYINRAIINDIYPGSSTYSKVVFREVLHQIELEFKSQF